MIQITPAQETDLPLILAYIKEFAEHIHSADQVKATQADLERTLFGERHYAEVLLGRVDEAPAGFALFFHTYSTFLGQPGLYLEDLFVRPAYRNRGLGAAFIRRLAQLAIKRGCGRFEWAVLTWNEDAMRFYHRLGAEPLDHLRSYRLTGENLEKLADSV